MSYQTMEFGVGPSDWRSTERLSDYFEEMAHAIDAEARRLDRAIRGMWWLLAGLLLALLGNVVIAIVWLVQG